MNKPFEQNEYDENDAPAKEKITRWLTGIGYTVVEGGQYEVDLITRSPDDKKVLVECEVKKNWKSERFPYSTVHCLPRKKKFFELPETVMLAMLNQPMTHAMIINGKKIIASKLITKNNIKCQNEQFYEINTSGIHIVNLNNGEVTICN